MAEYKGSEHTYLFETVWHRKYTDTDDTIAKINDIRPVCLFTTHVLIVRSS